MSVASWLSGTVEVEVNETKKGEKIMSYENAPATKMLATNCAACGRPLVDAISVETGMGPDCREKHGYNQEVSEEARAEANKLVHEIAVAQDGVRVTQNIVRLQALGFDALAARIVKRTRPIVIEAVDLLTLAVASPYSETFIEDVRHVPGRRWDNETKRNTIPTSSRAALWAALKRSYSGCTAIGPKGAFVIV